MIADFVDRRGGGLLMLGGAALVRRRRLRRHAGGRRAAAASSIRKTRASEPAPLARLKVAPTRAGQAHAVTQIAADRSGVGGALARSCRRSPRVNAPLPTKPGATVLLNGTDERGRTRAGAGVAAVRPRQGDRVHARRTPGSGRCTPSIPLEDQTHENFWRQLLRWLVDGVPDAVDVRTTTERVEPGEAVTIEADGRRSGVRRAERRHGRGARRASGRRAR